MILNLIIMEGEEPTQGDNNDGKLNGSQTSGTSQNGDEKRSNDKVFDIESESYMQKQTQSQMQTQFLRRSRKQNSEEKQPSNQEQPDQQEQTQKQESSTSRSSLQTQVFARGRMPVEVFMNPKLTTKDIHDTLWRCRDFELSHLWQRSIFLSAFLVLCFTGYGCLLMKFAEPAGAQSALLLHLFALILSYIAALFSAMWIMMAKGSKAWYEKYENGIAAFEKNPKYAEEAAMGIGGFACNLITDEREEHSVAFERLDLNNSLFKNNGGEYSPSRINIGIGKLSLIIWILAILVHAGFFVALLWNISICLAVSVVFGLLLLSCGLIYLFPKCFHSKTLAKLNKNKSNN